MAILKRVVLRGFKSVKDMNLELRPLTVLVGANGAGKSNLVSFFKMLNEMMGGRLQQKVFRHLLNNCRVYHFHHTQVLISTQSSPLLDSFDPEQVVVVDRQGKEPKFKRPDARELDAWLEEYTLGEIWEKNVIGGGPQ